MKTAILVSLSIYLFFFALSWLFAEERGRSDDDNMASAIAAMFGGISGVVFLALCVFSLVSMVWSSL